jgi:hypothetical protein
MTITHFNNNFNTAIVPFNNNFNTALDSNGAGNSSNQMELETKTSMLTSSAHMSKKRKREKEPNTENKARKIAIKANNAIFHKFLEIPSDIKGVIYSHMAPLDQLIKLRGASKEMRWIVNAQLMDMINKNKLSTQNLNIFNIDQLKAYFGDQCKDLIRLDLVGYFLNNNDVETIANSFPHLKHLFIHKSSSQKVTNGAIKSLSKLTLLESFKFDGNFAKGQNLTNFSFLKNYKHLNSFEISNYPIDIDLTNLGCCTNLNTLTINSSKIKNYDFLDKLNLITNVTFKNKRAEFTPINTNLLEKLKKFNLMHFHLSIDYNNSKIDYTSLAHHKNLETLEIVDPSLADWSIVDKFEHLKTLHIGPIQMNSCKFFQKEKQLTDLNISFNDDSSDLSFLKNFKNLTHLQIHYKRSFSGLAISLEGLNKLRSLSISGDCTVTCIKDCENLTNLNIQNAKIPQISFLENLNNLEELTLNKCNTKNLSPLQHLKKLKTLVLIGSKDMDMEYLRNLKQLRKIHFEMVDFQPKKNDPTLLTKLKYLRELNITYTTLKNELDKAQFKNLHYTARTLFPKDKKAQ